MELKPLAMRTKALQGTDTELPLLLRVAEAARLLDIGTTLAYELIGRGELPHIRLGRAVRVPRRTLDEWIAKNTRGAPGRPGART